MKCIGLIIFSVLAGLFIIDWNQNHEEKHPIIIGICGYLLAIVMPIAIILANYS